MAANDSTPPPPPPPPPPGMEQPPAAVPHIEAPPASPVVTPVEYSAPVAPPVPLTQAPQGPPRPDPYAPPAPGYSPAGYGYQAPANPPASPYAQPGEAGYGAQQPAYAQPVYAQAPYGYPIAPSKSLSITSMVLGLVGIFFGALFSVAAVITGHIAARREPHAKGFWLTGIITGYVIVVVWILIVITYAVLMTVYPRA
jgi:hypothetical protein